MSEPQVGVKPELKIGHRCVGPGHPTFFIADIAANHDGDLERARELIRLAAEAGADAAKFQHFRAATIVSDVGFKALGGQKSHQARWKRSVYEVYEKAEVDIRWTKVLRDDCEREGIIFFTSPYSIGLVNEIDPYVPAYKVGSGDISWIEIIQHIASKGKPYLIATGASTVHDVERAVSAALKINRQLCLMQCNTNYTASLDNFRYINLNVLKTYSRMFPDLVLGLSDHTSGHATVLGAIALGARVVEKHFTDDTSREGPDHGFSMDPASWREMIDRSRELELALGTEEKVVEENEADTFVLQRRALRLNRDLRAGHVLGPDDFSPLRPCPVRAVEPYRLKDLVGRTLKRDLTLGGHIEWSDLT